MKNFAFVILTLLAAASFTDLMPPVQNIVVRPHTNHYHLTLTGWTGSNTTLYWSTGTNGSVHVVSNKVDQFYWTNSGWQASTTSNAYTVSNLYPGNTYTFEIWSWNSWIDNPPFWISTNQPVAPISFTWPWPNTNFYNVSLGNNLLIVETNPPQLSKFYRASLAVSTNSLSATVQASTNLQNWLSFPGMFVLTNSAANKVLSLKVTNNLDGKMVVDR